MMIPLMTLALATHLTVTIADNVPRFNLEPLCRGFAQQGGFGLGLGLESNNGAGQNFKSCMRSEMASRTKLVKQWSAFRATDKANCIGEATAGGLSSYTDLLTCLQMATDVSKLNH